MNQEIKKRCLIVTTFIGYGDLLYHTPMIRALAKKGYAVDVWAKNIEPFMNNKHISNLYQSSDAMIPLATLFYPWGHFIVGNNLAGVSHPNAHVVDYISANIFRMMLINEDKSLDLFTTVADKKKANLFHYEVSISRITRKRRKVVVLSPVIGWPSRTLPLEWYVSFAKAARADGFAVVLVGKDVVPDEIGNDNPAISENEKKFFYPASEIPHDLCLYNKLSLHELSAFYDLVDVVVCTETGHLPIAGCSNECHILYVASLLHPEYRLPYRFGKQTFRTQVVHTRDLQYPTYGRFLEEGINLREYQSKPATPEAAYEMLKKCMKEREVMYRKD